MIIALSIALSIIAFAAAFHLHWAFGGSVGYSVSLPQRTDGQPVMRHRLAWWRPAAAAVALALVLLALVALSATGMVDLPIPDPIERATLVAAGSACCLRAVVPTPYTGFFKSIRTTRWARFDTRLYSPLFLLLGLALLALALG